MNTEGIGSQSRMRVALAALLAFTLLATLFVADSAEASSHLTGKRAKAMANNLLEKQLRDRDRRLIEARVTSPRRVNRRVVRFRYDDLSRTGVVCTGTIQVRRNGLRFSARFLSSNCERPGEEALAFRAQSRVVAIRFLRKVRSVRRSVTRYTENAQACENLRVPENRQGEASLLLNTGLVQATTRPLWGTLDDYAGALQALNVTDPQLAAGAAAWRDYTDAVRSLPALSGGYCGALAEWARNDYSDATAPVDFDALLRIGERLRADRAEVRRTARYLRRLGVDPVTTNAFTLGDLIGDTPIFGEAVR